MMDVRNQKQNRWGTSAENNTKRNKQKALPDRQPMHLCIVFAFSLPPFPYSTINAGLPFVGELLHDDWIHDSDHRTWRQYHGLHSGNLQAANATAMLDVFDLKTARDPDIPRLSRVREVDAYAGPHLTSLSACGYRGRWPAPNLTPPAPRR